MEHKLWINGQWVDSQGGGKMMIVNPATDEKITEVIDASQADVDRAVQAAQTAFYDGRWSKKTPGERSMVLWRLAASVFTNDVGRAMKLSAKLEFSTVWINDHLPLTSETPHGGFKQSGFGKDLSAEAVGDYQITKHVMVAHG